MIPYRPTDVGSLVLEDLGRTGRLASAAALGLYRGMIGRAGKRSRTSQGLDMPFAKTSEIRMRRFSASRGLI